MGDRLLEGGAAQRLVAGLAPPFDGGVGHARLREMMRQRFRLGRRRIGEAVAQNLGDAAVQNLAPALEQIFVGRVLDERVLEAVVALGRQALDQHDVGVGELFQRRLQRRIVHPGDRAQQAVGEAAADHRADLRYLARRAEAVEPRRQRLLQRRRDGVDAALLAALQEEPRHFLDEQRNAAGAGGDIVDHFTRQRVAGRKLGHHVAHLRAIERRQRDGAVMRTHAPGRPKLRPRRRHDEQRRRAPRARQCRAARRA